MKSIGLYWTVFVCTGTYWCVLVCHGHVLYVEQVLLVSILCIHDWPAYSKWYIHRHVLTAFVCMCKYVLSLLYVYDGCYQHSVHWPNVPTVWILICLLVLTLYSFVFLCICAYCMYQYVLLVWVHILLYWSALCELTCSANSMDIDMFPSIDLYLSVSVCF